ncbi:hypothetical protein ACFE04_007456 [Oxalis oulophora]
MAPKTPKTGDKTIPYFKSGSLVEISSDDPGFRGSWYTGKVIRRISLRTPSKFSVAYTHIFADEAGTKPLVEVFDSTYQIRPPPPPSEREKAGFKFGDEVDAFHNDGWWEGTITKEIANDDKFQVFFRGTREKIVFGRDQLRVHREWINGVWNPPLDHHHLVGQGQQQQQQQQNPPVPNLTGAKKTVEKRSIEGPVEGNGGVVPVEGNGGVVPVEGNGGAVPTETVSNTNHGVLEQDIFIPGTLVEISSDEEGFEGAWFIATVAKLLGDDKFLVEHHNLRTDDDKEKLKEEVDRQHIRPPPPEKIMVDSFTMYDEVDAWYNEAWWVGVVTKVHANLKYTIFFKDSLEEIKFNHSDLRVHQEWIDGKWHASSKKNLSFSQLNRKTYEKIEEVIAGGGENLAAAAVI